MKHVRILSLVAAGLIVSLSGQFSNTAHAARAMGRSAFTLSDNFGMGRVCNHLYLSRDDDEGWGAIWVTSDPAWFAEVVHWPVGWYDEINQTGQFDFSSIKLGWDLGGNGTGYISNGMDIEDMCAELDLKSEGDELATGYANAIRHVITAQATGTVRLNMDYKYELDLTGGSGGYVTFAVAFWRGDPWEDNLLLTPGSGWVVATQDIAEMFPKICPDLDGTQWSVLEKTISVSSGQSTGVVSVSKNWNINVTAGMEYSCLIHVEASLSETAPPEPPQPEPWSFVHMTDTHVGYTEQECGPLPGSSPVVYCWEGASASDRLAAAIDQILQEVKSGTRIKPDFILVTGDIVDYACSDWFSACNDLYGDFILAMQRAFDQGIEVVTVPGNHDRAKRLVGTYLGICGEGLNCYFQHLVLGSKGDTCGDLCSFDHKGVCFIGLDTGESGWRGLPGLGAKGEGLARPQWEAFKAKVEENPVMPKVVFMHHPPVDVGWRDQTFKHYREDFITCCANNDVRLVLAGHTHEDHVLDGIFIQTRSVGKGPPRGYRWVNVTYMSPPSAHPETSSDVLDDSDRIRASLYSHGSLHMYDLLGEHHTGMTTTGEAELGIPRSYYFSHHVISTDDGDEVLPEKIIVFGQANDYLYEVIGSETGTYRMEIKSVQEGGETVFRATEIPTLPGAKHFYAVNWPALSDGEEGVILEIDVDGDGVFEKTVIADEDLTSEEFALQTETVIDFNPDSLNLGSKGKYVTVYIELPEGADVTQIDVSSLKLNDTVPALLKPFGVGDYDDDGIADLMVKFDRKAVAETLEPGEQIVNLTGRLADGTQLAGMDTIRVLAGKGAKKGEQEFDLDVESDGWVVVEEAAFSLFEASDVIEALEPENFRNKKSAAKLSNEIDLALGMIDGGLYEDALDVLENDILKRTDGYAEFGEPDKNDWITTYEGQVEVYPLIMEAIELLESLM